MERTTPASKASRAQRLSAMIDSLHAVQSNEDLLGLPQSSAANIDEEARLTSPGPMSFAQPPKSYLSAGSSPYQASSSMSSYSGVVGEAVEAVRGGQDQPQGGQLPNLRDTVSSLALNSNVENMNVSSTENKGEPPLPLLPSEEVLRKTSYAHRLPSFIREGSQTPVETIVGVSSSQKSTSTSTGSPSKTSIPSHLDLTKDQEAAQSQGHSEEEDSVSRTSVEIASLSIRDPGHHSTDHNVNLNSFANADIIEVSDSESITSSVVKPLLPEEDIAANGDLPPSPVAPPRSKNRPRANLLPTAPLAPERDSNVNSRKSLVSIQSTTNNSESYYSAASFLPDGANDDMHNPLNYIPQNAASTQMNPAYFPKPQSYSHGGILGDTPSKIHTNDMDNIYEDIHPATLPRKNENTESNVIQVSPRKTKEKKSPRKKQHKKSKSKERRSFDIETISELLNVTGGTMVGSEFTNLGLQTKEKQLLERLVDSLSRLTADMVLDPNRYEEGLKRLNKATKALEGFDGK
ncbi:hypothetical protein DAKH74_046040 [Maudiozyma humilis]|uniref:Protein NBA1 n=1 Tax=Maudiozyma humilis TaxID=51915 RepID=A0AAV5S553_MAUHU|nr:hypothetical protein DAKH74_046040 [Kazachstania humilis]